MACDVRAELCILSLLAYPVFLVSTVLESERADNIWPERDKDGEERPAIMETLLQFCNEHKKWKHIRYYPALVNLSMPPLTKLRLFKLL